MVSVNFEAIDMEEKYYEILRHYINPNDCATVVRQILDLHNVSKCEPISSCDDEVINKAIKKNLTMKFSDGTLRKYHDDWGQATPTHVYVC